MCLSGDVRGQNDFLKERLLPVFGNLELSRQREFCRRGASNGFAVFGAFRTSGRFVTDSRHVHVILLYSR